MKHIRPDYNRRIQDSENKIPENEPVMLFRAQDIHFCKVLRFYAVELRNEGNKEMADAVSEHVLAAVNWQLEHGYKSPDMPVQMKIDFNSK